MVADGGQVTVVAPDRPGLLATVAGVLSLSGPRSARPCPAPTRAAIGRARVRRGPRVRPAPGLGPPSSGDLEAALDGRLALEERLEERERHYARRRRVTARRRPRGGRDHPRRRLGRGHRGRGAGPRHRAGAVPHRPRPVAGGAHHHLGSGLDPRRRGRRRVLRTDRHGHEALRGRVGPPRPRGVDRSCARRRRLRR